MQDSQDIGSSTEHWVAYYTEYSACCTHYCPLTIVLSSSQCPALNTPCAFFSTHTFLGKLLTHLDLHHEQSIWSLILSVQTWCLVQYNQPGVWCYRSGIISFVIIFFLFYEGHENNRKHLSQHKTYSLKPFACVPPPAELIWFLVLSVGYRPPGF